MADSTQSMIDSLLLYEDNVADPTVLSLVQNRRRHRRNLQRSVNWFWHMRDWYWKTNFSTVAIVVAVPSPGPPQQIPVFNMPAGFSAISRNGGLFRDPRTRPLKWIPQFEYFNMFFNEQMTGDPAVWTEITQDMTGFTGQKIGAIYPIPNTPTNLYAVWQASVPQLYDAGDLTDTTQAAPDQLQMIPADYHETVLYERAVWQAAKDKGDMAKIQVQAELVLTGLEQAIINQRQGRQHSTKIVPYGVAGHGLR